MASNVSDVTALLPLQPATFHILLTLATDSRHGYGIMQEVETRTRGAIRLSPGTLYSAISRLLEQGLIVERKAAGRGIDPRRRYYAITAFGTAVARAETRRLADLVRMARGAGLLVPEAT